MTNSNIWKNITEDNQNLDESTVSRLLDTVYSEGEQFLRDDALLRIEKSAEYYEYLGLGDAFLGTGQYWRNKKSLGYAPTVLVINLANWFVKKRSSWMFEVAPDIEVIGKTVDSTDKMNKIGYEPSKKQVKQDNAASDRESILYHIWNENRFEEKLMAGATDFFVGGTCALKLRYLPGNGIKMDFAPAHEVFPIPNHDEPTKMDGVVFASHYNNYDTVWKQEWMMSDGYCWVQEGLYDASTFELLDTIVPLTNTQLPFVPVVLFPNDALTNRMFGESYLRDMIPLFDQYNKTMSDATDSLRFSMFAVTVLLNAPPDAENMVKVSPQEVWNLGGEGVDAKKLESSFNYSGALADFLTRLENVMHMIGEVPDITPDRIKGFGLVSGVALKLLYSDLVSATQRSWRIWKSRLTLVNEYILRMLEIYQATPEFPYNDLPISSIQGNYENRIIPHLPLPENETEIVSLEIQKMANSLQSVKGAMQRTGEQFPERKIAEILSERKEFMQAGDFGKQITTTERDRLFGEAEGYNKENEEELDGKTS